MDKRKIAEFSALVAAVQAQTKPLRLALIASNAIWAAVVIALLRNHQG